MAVIEKNFLDLPGLQQYDQLIKQLIPQADNITIEINENGKLSLKSTFITYPTVKDDTLVF